MSIFILFLISNFKFLFLFWGHLDILGGTSTCTLHLNGYFKVDFIDMFKKLSLFFVVFTSYD